MEYKELALVKGIPVSFEFEALDETGIPYDLTSASVKFEVLNRSGKLVLTKTVSGSATVNLTVADTLKLSDGNYHYRLVLQSLPGPVPVKKIIGGTLVVDGTTFDSALTEGNGQVILSSGSIYPTGPTVLVPGLWYAIASFFRFTVSGVGIVALDGRDLTGNITGNLSSYISNDTLEKVWHPNLGFNTEFRLNNIVAAPVVTYLP